MQDDERPLCVPLVLRQFATCFLHRDSSPFDFLSYQPYIGCKCIRASTLHPFWFDVWRHWSKTPTDKRILETPSYEMVANMPVWLTTYVPMAIGATCHASKIVPAGANAPSSFWYLWPQLETLMRRNNPGTRVHMGRVGAAVYKHLCDVYDQVRR
ncbi:hypothetical protein SPRG_09170 [Saprolegnia parasitica CBS 223.65]|uniref:Uncharacterized protein n=1 Tax=Saprolegnia parasitica (strain CBS 223.65) TaxID=695850 RepID=A0A067C851_SAPPC|nr:hypothetical protein SPRG_09170 [Saprolegnia parasitica CBS 223.65]KDO25345.1 hypothetical protein SPRG_09170 [Saprolegnia parasitica CBS 223.65]|eukprot:XP_012203995.1 hypothetical protein SPRG_09170 [Saprolegnia parasitica CBS 223.65]